MQISISVGVFQAMRILLWCACNNYTILSRENRLATVNRCIAGFSCPSHSRKSRDRPQAHAARNGIEKIGLPRSSLTNNHQTRIVIAAALLKLPNKVTGIIERSLVTAGNLYGAVAARIPVLRSEL
jgi:hypothetical protein